MKKKFISIIFALFICLSLPVMVFAADYDFTPRLIDDANLLTDSEESEILNRLNTASEKYQVDFVIITVDSMDGYSAKSYANDCYDSCEYGLGDDRDGVMLLVSMEYRDWYILTNGLGNIAVTDGEVESIGSTVASSLGNEEYATAFNDFIDECEYEINGEINGFPFAFMKNLLISLAIGLVIALIVTGSMKRKLKSIHKQLAATEYTKPGSMQITNSTEFFLYSVMDRQRRSNNSSSSSGGSRGGGGGKF